MSTFEVTRRASLGVFGAVALACAGMPGGAFALTRAVGGIHVDVAPLRENAGDPTAAWVAQVMPGALAQALAEAGRPGAPISVRIDYVMLGSSGGLGQPLGSTPDQMVGAVIVGGVARPLSTQTGYSRRRRTRRQSNSPTTIAFSNFRARSPIGPRAATKQIPFGYQRIGFLRFAARTRFAKEYGMAANLRFRRAVNP